MNLIDDIKQRLRKYPNARYESDNSSITVLPVSDLGFSVTLTVNPTHGYTVSLAGWHDDFEDKEEAVSLFVFGLSEDFGKRG